MTRMGYKLLWTRLISGVVFGIGMWAYYPGYLNTERLSKLMGLPFQGKVTMLRSVAPVFLLLASISAPASAMDPSAMEETNCLMACDANQEHCGAGQAPLHRNRSVAAHLSQPEMKASPVPGLRRTTGPSTTLEGKVSRSNEGKH